MRKVEEEGRQDKRSRLLDSSPKMGVALAKTVGAQAGKNREKRQKGGSPCAWSDIIFVHLDRFPFSAPLFLGNAQWVRARDHRCTVQRQSYVKIKLSRIMTLFFVPSLSLRLFCVF
jgi:hypothetical protein